MADTTLKLGDFTFQNFEIPASISLGGEQVLVIHRLPGGTRVVQSMGRDDAPIGWSGSMYSQDALDRMRQLDLMRTKGEPLNLTFMGLSYLVVIKSFLPRVERSYRVQYTIEVVVVVDKTQAQQQAGTTSIDSAIRSDASAASTLGGLIGDSSLTSSLASLTTAVAGVSNFKAATASMLNVVRNPATSAATRVAQLLNSANTVVDSVSVLGGVSAGASASASAAAFKVQADATGQMANLYSAQAALGRLTANLNQLSPSASGQTVTTAGGNLFSLAQKAYGDATKWISISQANKISDPVLTGLTTVSIPSNPPDNGGLPNT